MVSFRTGLGGASVQTAALAMFMLLCSSRACVEDRNLLSPNCDWFAQGMPGQVMVCIPGLSETSGSELFYNIAQSTSVSPSDIVLLLKEHICDLLLAANHPFPSPKTRNLKIQQGFTRVSSPFPSFTMCLQRGTLRSVIPCCCRTHQKRKSNTKTTLPGILEWSILSKRGSCLGAPMGKGYQVMCVPL